MKKLLAIFLCLSLQCSASQFFVSTSSQGLLGGGLVINRPCTVSFWVNLTAITGLPVFWCTTPVAGTPAAYVFVNNTIDFKVRVVDGTSNMASSNTVSTGSWVHILVTFNSGNSRTLYVNNVATGPDTSGGPQFDFITATRTSLGYYYNGTVAADYTDGYLSDFAFYNAALTAADVAALYAGASPLRVRPSALANYFPLTGNLQSRTASGGVSNINASTYSFTGPRIYR